jgi:hypothetical protein
VTTSSTMTASSTTFATSRRKTSYVLLAAAVRSMAALLKAVRAAWNDMAQAGQLGPEYEAEIGRQTGARI